MTTGAERPVRTPTQAVSDAFDRITSDGRDGIWITLADRDAAMTQAENAEQRIAAGHDLPLAGYTVALKDNIDVLGLPTTAGCPSFAYRPSTGAPAVQSLLDAGAVVVGKTNLDQFATGLVGTRSPYGVCPNAHWPGLIPGGSSSGSAVAVAAGLVDLALGTDTAGSGRVPAAANGIVGMKSTRGRISTAGVVPACRSLDCVSVFARSVDDAARAAELAARSPIDTADPWRRSPPAGAVDHVPRPLRIGVPTDGSLEFDGDADARGRFQMAVNQVSTAVADVALVPVDLAPFFDAASLLYDGAFVAERYEAVGSFVESAPDGLDPVVASIILAAHELPAWQVFRDQTSLQRLRHATLPVWDAVDVMIVPSVPRIPTVAEVVAEPIAVNSMLGTYTNFVNLLDLTAVTMPVPSGDATEPLDGPPPSVTFIGQAWSDHLLVDVARRVERGIS